MTGAQAVVRSLEEIGTEVVFGIPGGAILPVIGLALLVLPLLGLILRAPWGDLAGLFVRQEVLQALGLSLLTATLSTGLSLVLGIPLAVLLSRSWTDVR